MTDRRRHLINSLEKARTASAETPAPPANSILKDGMSAIDRLTALRAGEPQVSIEIQKKQTDQQLIDEVFARQNRAKTQTLVINRKSKKLNPQQESELIGHQMAGGLTRFEDYEPDYPIELFSYEKTDRS